jgi:hypothetical protein
LHPSRLRGAQRLTTESCCLRAYFPAHGYDAVVLAPTGELMLTANESYRPRRCKFHFGSPELERHGFIRLMSLQ